MTIYDLILRRRSIRRFLGKEVPPEILEKFINAGRLAPSGANLQPLEFIVVDDKNLLERVFSTLHWAKYLENGSPPEGERPRAYIVVLLNREINPEGHYDVGLAVENIILTALEEEVASCCIGTIDRDELRRILAIPENFSIELVVALGYPGENSVTEEFTTSVRYWRDEKGLMHVPKRKLIMHRNGYAGGE